MNPQRLLPRRRFLLHGGSLLASLPLAVGSCASRSRSPGLQRCEFENPQMGVPFRLVFYAQSRSQGEDAAQAVMARIAFLNSRLSDYEEDSELTQLNLTAGTGRAVKVSPELWTVLQEAQRLARLSGGAFDITAGPYISLWRRARRIHRLPEPEKLAAAQKAVGYHLLRLDQRNRTATLLAPRMKLDLGGLAKGYAADEALKVFRRYGIPSALVAASGDTSVAAAPPQQKGWQIEIGRHPDAPPAASAKILQLSHHSVATSGDAYQAVVLEGRRYSHIVNPFTGLGLTDQSQVTVIHPHGIVADALATAISVLGPRKGLDLAESQGAALLYQRKLADRIEEIASRRFGRFLQA